jgi:hypothetical protein
LVSLAAEAFATWAPGLSRSGVPGRTVITLTTAGETSATIAAIETWSGLADAWATSIPATSDTITNRRRADTEDTSAAGDPRSARTRQQPGRNGDPEPYFFGWVGL